MQKENNITCHSELVSEFQTGRSMVEMLGVLAVMGVLSVGGVAMYTSAMNKHKANELLNEASKRATAVAAQISMQGKDPENVSIAEFINPSGYTFGVAKKNANQFNITINAVDNDICIQMKTASGTNTPIRKINNECTELTYNNDMSTTVWASDFTYDNCPNSFYKCESTNSCLTSEDECPPSGPECPGDSSKEVISDGTSFFITEDGKSSVCYCPQGKSFREGKCQNPPNSCDSYTSNQCGLGYYCSNISVDCDNGGKIYAGTCAPITGDHYSQGYYYSSQQMEWFEANSWCIGKGSSGLISSDTLSDIAGITLSNGYTDEQNHYLWNYFCGTNNQNCLPSGGSYWVSEVYDCFTGYSVNIDSYWESFWESERGMYYGSPLCAKF